MFFGNPNVKKTTGKAAGKCVKTRSLGHSRRNRHNIRILFCQMDKRVTEAFGKTKRIEFFKCSVRNLERPDAMERSGVIFRRTVAFSLYRAHMDDDRFLERPYTGEHLFHLADIMPVQRADILKAKVGEKIIGEKKSFQSALKTINEFSQMML